MNYIDFINIINSNSIENNFSYLLILSNDQLFMDFKLTDKSILKNINIWRLLQSSYQHDNEKIKKNLK